MKNKDLSQNNADRDKEKKNSRAKKLGDKIGPVNHSPNQGRYSKHPKKDEYSDQVSKNRDEDE